MLHDKRPACIYALSDETGIRYIGQTVSKTKKRLSSHLAGARKKPTTHKDYWIRSVLSRGGSVQISTIEEGIWTLPERDEREVYWIAEYERARSNRNRKTCSKECRYKLVVEKRKANG